MKNIEDFQRFVILKIKFAQVKDGRVFVNVNEVIELQEAFERFAKSISLVMDVMDFRPEDLNFFRNVLERNQGNQKLKFYIRDYDDDFTMQHIEVQSMKYSVNLNSDLIQNIQLMNKYEFYLN